MAGSGLSDDERDRLDTFMRANIVSNAGFTLGLVVIYIAVLRSGWVLLLAATVLVVVVGLFVARRLLVSDDPVRGLYVNAAVQWFATVVPCAVVPFVLPMLTPVALLPVMLMVPHLPRARLLAMTVCAVLVVSLGAIFAELHLIDLQERAPEWLRRTIVLVAVPVAVGMVALTAWQNHLGLSAQTDELRRSRARVVAAADEERRRIERDLHDGTQQHLVAIAVQLGLLRRAIPKDPARAKDIAELLVAELDHTITELRDLAHGVYPPLLEQRGLVEALNAAVIRSQLPVTVEAHHVGRYGQDLETAVYFCCLEALQNATKHAAATAVVVRLDGRRGLIVEVTDDGRGFDPDAVAPGHGFANMRDRVGATSGALSIDSRPGQGTTVRLWFPLAHANHP